MNESLQPWWVLTPGAAWIAACIVMAVGIVGGILTTAWHNRRLRRRVEAIYGGLVEHFGPIAVAVPGRTYDLMVGPQFVHFYDPQDEVVFASVAMNDVTHLKIFEQARDSIRFCLRLRSGIDTIPVETDSPASFTDLFHQLTQYGKQVIYVPR
ncbi:MAG: hypothetical protein WDO73_00860 [Ignavibacteriota bacterium]